MRDRRLPGPGVRGRGRVPSRAERQPGVDPGGEPDHDPPDHGGDHPGPGRRAFVTRGHRDGTRPPTSVAATGAATPTPSTPPQSTTPTQPTTTAPGAATSVTTPPAGDEQPVALASSAPSPPAPGGTPTGLLVGVLVVGAVAAAGTWLVRRGR